MPPKSAKKESKSLWYNCDKCNVKLPQAKLQSHESECGKNEFGIVNESFITNSIITTLPPELELKEAPKIFLQRFLFIPESICNFCRFSMGSKVLIQYGNKQFVKESWTINDKHVDGIFCSASGYLLYNCNHMPFFQTFLIVIELQAEPSNKIIITKLTENVQLANSIELNMLTDLQNTKELEILLKAKLKNTVIHQDTDICIEFLNKTVWFSIARVDCMLESDDIADQMAQINLTGNKFYMVELTTAIKIRKSSTEPDSTSKGPSLKDIGGLDDQITDLRRIMTVAIETNDSSSTKLTRSVLIHSTSGCGKSMLCRALANSFPNAHQIHIDSWKIFSKFYGETETNLKKHFDEAYSIYPRPSIIIIDEITNVCPKSDSSDAVRRVVALMVSLLDSLHSKRNWSKTFVLCNTNNLDNVDPTIRRSGRLDYEMEIPVPNMDQRGIILEKLLNYYDLSSDEIKSIARHTHGYVGADLENLIARSVSVINGLPILTAQSLMDHLPEVKPSAMRELLIERPDVRWTDIGGMHDVKLKLQQIVEWPLNHPETFQRLGIKPPRGLLMFGPPGCSKTLIAKALATESRLNFIAIKGSDLFSMWVGESEKAVRDVFKRARQLAPCIVFFDEIDAIGGERSAGSSVKERVLAQILTEIDGVHALRNVIIIGATNRPDLIDSALMRPGRLDRIVYVRLPDAETRQEIFHIKLAKIPIASDVNIDELVEQTNGYSGAEIEAICKEAALRALEESFDIQEISMKYFNAALEMVRPRTSAELLQIYNEYEMRK